MKFGILTTTVVASAWAASAATNEIIVTATRMASDVKGIPGNPIVITSSDLQQGGFTSTPDALSRRAGLHIRNFTDNPSRASVDIRGFGENSHGRVLVLVNGRRINRPDLGPVNWAQVPVGNIERIEVLRGAQTALYGDYAVGGVINIITNRGQDEPQTAISVAAGSHGFTDKQISTSGDLNGVGYNFSMGHQSSDGYRERSAFETSFDSLSLQADIKEYLDTWLDYSYTDSEYEMPGGLSEAQLLQDRRQAINKDDDAQETFHNVGFGLGLYPHENHEATADFGYSRKDLEANFPSYSTPAHNTWSIDTYTFSPKYVYSLTPFNMDNTLTLGVDVSYDNLDVSLFSNRTHSAKTGSSIVEKETAGLYLHNQLSVLDNLIFSFGARTERSEYTIEERDGSGALLQDTSDIHKVEAYSAGITYLPAEPLKVFARFEKLYRLPFLDEQISYQGFASGFNKDLDPETGRSYEVGFAVLPSDNFDLSCTLFRMDMKDEIAFVWPVNVNLDETRHQGLELSGNLQAADQLGFYASYTFQEVEFTEGANKGNEVPLVPMHLLSVGMDAEPLNGLHFLINVQFTDEQFAGGEVSNADTARLDSYTLIDTALRYEIPLEKVRLALSAGIYNLTSEKYSPVGYSYDSGTVLSYYPAPERTYKIGMQIDF